jgi:hypothetical protein
MVLQNTTVVHAAVCACLSESFFFVLHMAAENFSCMKLTRGREGGGGRAPADNSIYVYFINSTQHLRPARSL